MVEAAEPQDHTLLVRGDDLAAGDEVDGDERHTRATTTMLPVSAVLPSVGQSQP